MQINDKLIHLGCLSDKRGGSSVIHYKSNAYLPVPHFDDKLAYKLQVYYSKTINNNTNLY